MAPSILFDESPATTAFTAPVTDKLFKNLNQTTTWPTKINGPLVWDGRTLSEADFTHQLNNSDVEEINAALAHFKTLGLDGSKVTRDTFPLPTLGAKLHDGAVELHRGKGALNIRGLNPADYSAEDNVLLFLGISSYIGEKRARQDEDGNMLIHVSHAKATRAKEDDKPTRYSNRASTFHTDTFCDILALHTRATAAKGGAHLISSSANVFNKMAAIRPDLLAELVKSEWSFDSRGSLFECNTRPLMYHVGGNLILNFSREPLLGLPGVKRTEGLRETTPLQKEALDLIEKLAQESQVTIKNQPGDLTFINNHAVLHSREAFEDADGQTRHMVRMWLKNPEMAWRLPSQLQVGNTRIYDDDTLGERWNLVDVPRFNFKLSERLTS